MHKRYVALAIALLFGVGMLGSPAPVDADFPAGKAYDAFVWFGLPPGFLGFSDCIEFTGTKVCSLISGNCSAYSMDYYDGVNGVASVPVFKFLGGKGDFSFVWERRGPKTTLAGAGQVKDFFPFRTNMMVQGFGAPYCEFLRGATPDLGARSEHPGRAIKGDGLGATDRIQILE